MMVMKPAVIRQLAGGGRENQKQKAKKTKETYELRGPGKVPG